MGRIIQLENLPASEVSSEDAKIYGHSRITLADSVRERGMFIVFYTICLHLTVYVIKILRQEKKISKI